MNKAARWLEGIQGEKVHELIESQAPVIRVVAGPGSGKTTCLKRRTQRLIEGDGINPSKIYVGTFTRAVTDELKQELGDEVNVSTLHSLAYQLLREHPGACQGMCLRFLLNFEQDALLYDIDSDDSGLGNILANRKELLALQASRSRRANFENAVFAGAVWNWLRRHRAMLIGEVVFLCVRGLESEDIPPGMFDHIVIDEYQDLTALEQELVGRVWSRRGSLTVMGDDDQSIYGFRFNHPDGISTFHESWVDYGCKDLTFSDNYRCGKEILNTANLIMAEMGSRKSRMIPRRNQPGEQNFVYWKTINDEIKGLANYINSRPNETFLVLVPRRFIGYRLAEEIGPDAKTSFTEEVLEHTVAQEAFTALSMLADPNDWVSARTWLGFHGKDPIQADSRNSQAYSRLPDDLGGHELIHGIASDKVKLAGAGRTHIKKRAKKAVELINRNLDPKEVIDFLFREDLGHVEPEGEKRDWLIKALNELRNTAHHLIADQDTPDLSKVVTTMRYSIATRSALMPDAGEPRVKIMTLHSAKGLEADNVVIAGVTTQFMPGYETNSEKIKEQRRLLYVAVTRAKSSLIISWSKSIRVEDLMANMGTVSDRVRTINGVKWSETFRSYLLPQGLTGIIPGEKLLAEVSEDMKLE